MAVQHRYSRAVGRGAAALMAAAAAAAATGELCKLDPAPPGAPGAPAALKTYTCALCENTTTPLAGEGYTWIVGGEGGQPCPPGGSAGPWGGWRVLAGGTVRGNGKSTNVGPLTVAGADVAIEGVTTSGVVVKPPGAPRLKLTGITIEPVGGGKCVALTAAAPQTSAGEIAAPGLAVTGVAFGPACTGERVVAAFAFATLGGGEIACKEKEVVITQLRAPVTPADLVVTGKGCTLADVGGMLNVFGTRYEVLYNDFAYIPHASGFAHWVSMLVVANFILAVMLVLCGWAKWDGRKRAKVKTT